MGLSDLALRSASQVTGVALTGFGLSLGRQVHRNFGSVVGVVIAIVCGLGGVILPFMMGRKWCQWHPVGKGQWFFQTFLKWSVLGIVGWGMLWVAVLLLALIQDIFSGLSKSDAEIYEMVGLITWVLFVFIVMGGMIKGFGERGLRKRTHQLGLDNQAMMDDWGIKEMDGGDVTHRDGSGHHLRLINVGSDLIEFSVRGKGNKRAFIEVGSDGLFETYSGVVDG